MKPHIRGPARSLQHGPEPGSKRYATVSNPWRTINTIAGNTKVAGKGSSAVTTTRYKTYI
jgi:hypothetical protein